MKGKAMYDLFKGEELKIAEKIQQRRRQMIVHSCIYYVFDDNIVSDHKWAQWGLELKELQERYPDIAKLVPLAPYFKDWDASTGYNLPIHEDWVINKAKQLMRLSGKAVY